MQTWKPITTAPRDETEIIVGYDMASVWIVRSARWVNGSDWIPEGTAEDTGWWSYRNSVSQEKLDGIREPTHWLMETPIPPGHGDVLEEVD